VTDIPFGVGAYRRSAGGLPEARLVNCFVEKSPTSPTGIVLLSRPGLSAYLSLGGASRGVYCQAGTFNNDVMSVSGTTLYRNATAIGAIPGAGLVSIAGDGNEMVIANGSGLYRTDGVGLTTIAFPDAAGVSSVAYLGGYLIGSRTGSQKFYWSGILDGTTWNALSFASAERAPDNLVALTVVGDELWLFGEVTTEPWVPTGDLNAPFSRQAGRLYSKGCRSKDTVVVADNTAFWVGNDGIVYRGSAIPQRVSDFGIEERIANTPATSLKAWTFTFEGHAFYVLTTVDGTFAYDISTTEWAEFASYGRTGWRAHVGAMLPNGTVVAGDDTTGMLWQLTRAALTDNGDAIVKLFTAGTPASGKGFALDNVELDMATGLASLGLDPVIEMRRSRNGGLTWTNWRAASAGKLGSYGKRVAWRRLGHVSEPGIIMEFRMTDAAPWRISRLRGNDASGANGR
jgi:hypothetical protein